MIESLAYVDLISVAVPEGWLDHGRYGQGVPLKAGLGQSAPWDAGSDQYQLPDETRVRASLVEAPEPHLMGDFLRLQEFL